MGQILFRRGTDNTKLFDLMSLSTTDEELLNIAKKACSNDIVNECLRQYFAWDVDQYYKVEK